MWAVYFYFFDDNNDGTFTTVDQVNGEDIVLNCNGCCLTWCDSMVENDCHFVKLPCPVYSELS